MKTLKHFVLLAILILLASCNTNSEQKINQNTIAAAVHTDKDNYVTIYDFHNEHRCVTCLKIENAVKTILEESYKMEMDDQLLSFELYNCETEENQNLAEEYGAFGTTLAITIVKDGNKEIRDLTNWAFETIGTDQFETGFVEELNLALAKVK
jgi:hypothetical protein